VLRLAYVATGNPDAHRKIQNLPKAICDTYHTSIADLATGERRRVL
jgi:hypothetical protein